MLDNGVGNATEERKNPGKNGYNNRSIYFDVKNPILFLCQSPRKNPGGRAPYLICPWLIMMLIITILIILPVWS